MVLLGDEAQVDAHFGLFSNLFGRTRWNSSVTWFMWNPVLVHLETMLVSVQDRRTVFTKHTIGLEIVLDATDGTPR
jgi:hypothetical protein